PEPGAAHFKEHAVQIITDVLLRHCKSTGVDQFFQLTTVDVKFERTSFIYCARKICSGQGSQRKTAATGFDNKLVFIQAKFKYRIVWQGLADIHQLSARDSDFARA